MSDITRFGDKIQFDEQYDDTDYEETTLYFVAPVEMLHGKYPEAVSTEISLSFPSNIVEPKYAAMMYSPTREEGGCLTDYDWFDVEFSNVDFDCLIYIWLDRNRRNKEALE